MDSISLKPGEHACILGCTGSGKTILSEFLLSDMNRAIVVDPKLEFKLPGYTRRFSLWPWEKEFRLIWRPRRSDDLKLAGLLRRAWKKKNLTIYVDELQSLTDFFPQATAVLSDVIRTGRSRRVSVWTATQRPAWVPRWFLSESRHKFVFTLLDKADRLRASDVIGDAAKQMLDLHDFYYHAPGLTTPELLTYNLRLKQIERAVSTPSGTPKGVTAKPPVPTGGK